MKKILAVLLLSLFILACNDEERVVDLNEMVEISWYNVGAQGNSKDHDMVMKKVNEYLKEKLNIKLDYTIFDYSEFEQKMQVKIAAGEEYDISFTSSWLNNYWRNVDKGAYLELTDEMMNEYAPEYMEIAKPDLWEATKVNGKAYSTAPARKIIAVQSRYVFNKKFVDKYDFDITRSNDPEYFEYMLKTIKENEIEIIPFDPNNGINFAMMVSDVMTPAGVRLDRDKIEVVNQFEQPEFLEKALRYRDYFEKGYIDKEVVINSGQDSWANQKTFSKIDTYSPLADQIWSNALGFDVVTVPESMPIVNNTNTLGSLQAISMMSPNPERALQLLNLVNTDPYLRNLLEFGIEGIHYEKNEVGEVVMLPRGDDYSAEGYTIGSPHLLYPLVGAPKDLEKFNKKFESDALVSPLLGFTLDVNPIKTETAVIANIKDEMLRGIVTGGIEPEKALEEFLNRIDAAGGDKVIEEVRKQIKAWEEAKK